MICSFWRRTRFWLLQLGLVLSCLCLPVQASDLGLGGIPYPKVSSLSGWQYRWGDSPLDADAQPVWLKAETGWQNLDPPLNPPGRQNSPWLWLRVRLPQLHAYDSLYLRGIDERFEVYLHQQVIYRFGDLPPHNRVYPGFPWHMIPLQAQDSEQWLYLRIHSTSRHIGIFGTPRLGSPAAHLQLLMLQDLDRIVVGCLLIFIGLLVYLLFSRQPVKGYRLLCLFAVTIGAYVLCRTEIKQIFGLSPAVWKWIEYIGLFISVPALCLFLNRLFGRRGAKIWQGLIWLQVTVCTVSLLLAAGGVLSIQDTTTPFLLLTLGNMLVGLTVVFWGFRSQGENGRLVMTGLLALCLFTGLDILVSLKWIPWIRPIGHWGLLLLMISLVFLVKQQVEQAYHDKRVAEEASRTKSEFLTNISHEIRTPLNAILGFTDLLAKEFQKHPKATEYLQIIHTSGQTLLMLINDILDLSKMEAQRMQLHNSPVQLRQLSEEIHQLFRLSMQQKGLSWELDLDPDLPRCVMLDGVRLRQILLNLVGNALKFTDSGGVKLKMSCVDCAAPETQSEPETRVSLNISVSDTGIGIPVAEQARIFEPFYQVERNSQRRFAGTGLGLSITSRFVELLGGKLEVSSEPEKGTCFSFEISHVEIVEVTDVVDEQDELVTWLEAAAEADSDVIELPLAISQPLLTQLQELQQNKSISKIQKFADHLVETAAQIQNTRLAQFGQQLKKALQHFDIGQINALLDQLKQSLQQDLKDS